MNFFKKCELLYHSNKFTCTVIHCNYNSDIFMRVISSTVGGSKITKLNKTTYSCFNILKLDLTGV